MVLSKQEIVIARACYETLSHDARIQSSCGISNLHHRLSQTFMLVTPLQIVLDSKTVSNAGLTSDSKNTKKEVELRLVVILRND